MLGGCGSPISVERLDARSVQRELTSNALTTGRLSGATQIALRRLDLLALWERDAPAAIRAVSRAVVELGGQPDLVFALAEIAFIEAERTNDRSYFLGTVVYSYAFLFPSNAANRPDPFDPRLRTAADLYNRALTRGLASDDGDHVDLRAGRYKLPFGTLTIRYDPMTARWEGRDLTRFIPAAELRVIGLQNRFRESGLGAPLAAEVSRIVEPPGGMHLAPNVKLPLTALLRLDISPQAISSGDYQGELVLYPGNEQRRVEVDGQKVPLEIEPTAAFAYALSNSTVWNSEIAGFFQGDLFANLPTQLFGLEPYRPGRIPVVLIHGTASSAGRWADMINDLQNDPAIRDKFQFWLFTYNTGNPIAVSAAALRESLTTAVARLDPERRDPALHQMVLVGHSQGGLLAKMLVIDPGSQLFDAFSKRPLDELKMSDETREMVRRSLFVSSMPDVSRVIFIATPHRGSFRASLSLARLISRFMSLPLNVTRMFAEAITGNADALRLDPRTIGAGSLFGMTPGSPFITALSEVPVSSRVAAHSIIAVTGDGPFADGDDGVVEYQSAHIAEAQSEKVIRWNHSVQGHPQTVMEVRRILLLQWASGCPLGCYAPVTVADAPVASTTKKGARPVSLRRP